MMAGNDEVYVEYHRIGQIVKATAIDANTGVEVSIQGPANLPQEHLRRVVVAKLRYVLAKRRNKPRGILV
ncbi:DUF6898 family protein [Nitrospirillum amazonense]|uniref:DUF6898 domain-containing protein n=1 Tax=Nitrospirillum amazonense TaxID=28077 RepID=A0A560K9I4_9PROT|nr:hypothetical protein [Nitrospirillum amazonense]MDG3441519.1 hypothetical protein [Nitrospirillum amazonense]TWB79988.1 hypothetical protein FBZ87_102411 [Nitrospirillum amazonense]